jgi:predicted PurR-regulated permease PerM
VIETLRNLPNWLRLTLVLPLLFLNGFLLSLLLNYLQPLINFIIIAMILAFVLELGIELLMQKGIQRGLAITIVLLITLFSLIILGLILIPLIVDQLGQLISNAPQWIEHTNKQLETWATSPIFKRFSIDINSILLDINKQLLETFKSLGSKLIDLIAVTIGGLFNTILILVLTIFLLLGGDKFWQGLFSYIPEPWHEKIPRYTKKTFKDYFLARLTLVLISSSARWILLLLTGVPYSALFGFGFGIVGFIPFLGTVLSVLGFIILGFNSLAAAMKFVVISVILDQINDNVLSPRIMGNAIGLNPVWLIISLFIGAKIGGLLGLFLAVPVASIIKQVIDDLRQPTVDDPNPSVDEIVT